jgi:DNA-binding transcriptional LysR family regulator
MLMIDQLYHCAMETRLLEYFVTVADESNVTAAAARLFAAQSTVSAGLASLERDLGVRLFERSTKAVRPTPAGEALLPLARALLADLDALRGVASESGTGVRGLVRIGTFAGLRVIDLPRILARLRRTHPLVDVRVTVSATGSRGLFDDLDRDRLDLALTALPSASGAVSRPLGSFPYVAVLPEAHPLALADGPIALAELTGDDWIDVLPGFGNRVQLDGELERRRMARHIVAEVGELATVPEYVAAGLGVAVIPDVVPTTGCRVRPVADDLPPWIVSLTVAAAAVRRRHVQAVVEAIHASG